MPVTSEVASVWPRTKPDSVAVSGGFGVPNSRDSWSAVTVSGAFVTMDREATLPVSAAVRDDDRDRVVPGRGGD